MQPLAPPAEPTAPRVWLLREDDERRPFAVRFESSDGRALLRVGRGGVTVDAPAASKGLEPQLELEALRSAVLFHIPGEGARAAWTFDTLVDDDLEALEATYWHELFPTVGRGYRRYVLTDPAAVIGLPGAAAVPASAPRGGATPRMALTSRPVDTPEPRALPVTESAAPEVAAASEAGVTAEALIERLRAQLGAEQRRVGELQDRLRDLEAVASARRPNR